MSRTLTNTATVTQDISTAGQVKLNIPSTAPLVGATLAVGGATLVGHEAVTVASTATNVGTTGSIPYGYDYTTASTYFDFPSTCSVLTVSPPSITSADGMYSAVSGITVLPNTNTGGISNCAGVHGILLSDSPSTDNANGNIGSAGVVGEFYQLNNTAYSGFSAGLLANTYQQDGTTNNLSGVYGVSILNGGTSSGVFGLNFSSYVLSGTLTSLYGAQSSATVSGGTCTGNIIGSYVSCNFSGGTLGGDLIGLYIQVSGTPSPGKKYAIKQIDASGINYLAGSVILPNLPTVNPHVVGELWSNAGVLNVSAG